MPHIEKRTGKRGVTWRVQITVGGDRRTQSFRRKTDAVEWGIATENAMRDGQQVPDRQERQRTVADLITRYRTEILPGYDEKEQGQRGGKLDWWQARLGTKRLRELRPRDIVECLDRLAAGDTPSGQPAAPATRVQYLAVLRHALSTAAKKWEWMRDNVAKLVDPPKKPRGRVRYLSPDERRGLLAACQASPNPRLHPLVVVALCTGARQGELLALRWSDIDFARCQATVQESKNDDRRALALTDQALAVLRPMRQIRQLHSDLVFATSAGQATFPRKAWEEALRQSNIEDFHFHDIRHTFASYLAMSGASLPELAAALGHKTLAMVQRYAHLAPAHTATVVARMAEKFLS
jgi:integrase